MQNKLIILKLLGIIVFVICLTGLLDSIIASHRSLAEEEPQKLPQYPIVFPENIDTNLDPESQNEPEWGYFTEAVVSKTTCDLSGLVMMQLLNFDVELKVHHFDEGDLEMLHCAVLSRTDLCMCKTGQCGGTQLVLNQLFLGQNPVTISDEFNKECRFDVETGLYKKNENFADLNKYLDDVFQNTSPSFRYKPLYWKSGFHRLTLLLDFQEKQLMMLQSWVTLFGFHWWLGVEDKLNGFIELDGQKFDTMKEIKQNFGGLKLFTVNFLAQEFPRSMQYFICLKAALLEIDKEKQNNAEKVCTTAYKNYAGSDSEIKMSWNDNLYFRHTSEGPRGFSVDEMQIVSQNIAQFVAEITEVKTRGCTK